VLSPNKKSKPNVSSYILCIEFEFLLIYFNKEQHQINYSQEIEESADDEDGSDDDSSVSAEGSEEEDNDSASSSDEEGNDSDE
jgi:hypothetical protein